MDTHRPPLLNPLYPSLDQYNNPPPPPQQQQQQQQHGPPPQQQYGHSDHQSIYPPIPPPSNTYNPNFPNYPPQQGGSFYNTNAYSQQPNPGKQVFDDLGAGLISNMAFGPVGISLLNNANQYVGSNVGRFLTLSPLKYYFNVNNSYVFNKIKLLLCPFVHKSWKRRIGRYNEVDSYVPPREDINAPDLYIPVMAFVTYILIVGFVLGTNLKFTPEVLGVTASTGLIILTFEILMIKAGFYLLNCGNVSLSDLTAYCGYKFVGVVINIVVGLLTTSYMFHIVTLYTGISMGIFMVRTLRIVLTLEQSGASGMSGTIHGGFSGPGMGMGPGNGGGLIPGTGDVGMSRNYFLLIVAALQVVIVYFLGINS